MKLTENIWEANVGSPVEIPPENFPEETEESDEWPQPERN
jgi:hypothetical protein